MTPDTAAPHSPHPPESPYPEVPVDHGDLDPADYDNPFSLDQPRPINWDLLSAEDLEVEWLGLNTWVNWLRYTYGLPATVIPPMWHRHPELVWELSALHTHWLSAYHPDQHASAPLGWHRDFADARQRLRDWTANSSTRLDRDRPTRQTLWPGEHPDPDSHDDDERVITNRDTDFAQHVNHQVRCSRSREKGRPPLGGESP